MSRLYDALGPGITAGDAGVLAAWLEGPSQQLDEVDLFVRGTADEAGWLVLFDPARTPYPRWLAQFAGVAVPGGLTDAEVRTLIVAQPAARRGSPAAVIAAAQAHLTGSRYVALAERDTSAYHLTVTTYTTETPSASAVNAALQAAKPAGLVLVHVTVPPTSYAALEAQSALTYGDAEALSSVTYTDWEAGA